MIAVVLLVLGLYHVLGASERFARLAPIASANLPNLFLTILVGFGVVSAIESQLRTSLTDSSQNLRLMAEVVETHAQDESVLFFNIHIYPTFPVVNVSGAKWNSPHGSMWVIPGVYTAEERGMDRFPYRDFDEMDKIERRFVADVVDDIEENQPVLIVVDRDVRKKGRESGGFDFLEYFRREPRFETLFANYVLIEKVGGFDVFKRKGFSVNTDRSLVNELQSVHKQTRVRIGLNVR